MEIEAEILQQLNPKLYLKTILNENIRQDGRQRNQIKQIILKTNYNSKCLGSSLVRWGKTVIICEVLSQIGIPHASSPNHGAIVFDVGLWPICSSLYDKNKKSDEAYALEATLRDIYLKNNSIDLEQLCIIPGQSAFCLTIQVICISLDGSLLDSIVLAISSALSTTSIPATSIDAHGRVTFIEDEERRPLIVSRKLASLTCGIFITPDSSEKHIILLDPSTFEADYHRITQSEVVLDHIISLVIDQDSNISYVHLKTSPGQSTGIPLELYCEACDFLAINIRDHLLALF